MIGLTKKTLYGPQTGNAKVVGKHRLGEGTYSQVFPEHIPGGGNFHPAPRNGHLGTHTVTSKGRK